MRVMLISNIDVKQRFANGTQGRLLYWHPGFVEKSKFLPASHPDLLVRFVKENAYAAQRELVEEVHFMDFPARSEILKGTNVVSTSMVQVSLQPAYALSNHKIQSLTVIHGVNGCLEGIFAHGSVYVLASRVNEPRNFKLIGLPPRDLLDLVAQKWLSSGLDINVCMQAACAVTKEWSYTPASDGRSSGAATNVYKRLSKRQKREQRIPVKLRTLQEALNPQPRMSEVLFRLMAWIDREDVAWRAGLPPPKFETEGGESIFPSDDEEWWLTDVQKDKKGEEAAAVVLEDGPPSSEDGSRIEDPRALISDDDHDEDDSEADDSGKDLQDRQDAAWDGVADNFNYEAAELQLRSEGHRLAPLSLWRNAEAAKVAGGLEWPTALASGAVAEATDATATAPSFTTATKRTKNVLGNVANADAACIGDVRVCSS
jgi:hypothetical protein